MSKQNATQAITRYTVRCPVCEHGILFDARRSKMEDHLSLTLPWEKARLTRECDICHTRFSIPGCKPA